MAMTQTSTAHRPFILLWRCAQSLNHTVFSFSSSARSTHHFFRAAILASNPNPSNPYHVIISLGVDGRRPEGLYIRKIHCNTSIYTFNTKCNTPVSGANEISFIVINHFLI